MGQANGFFGVALIAFCAAAAGCFLALGPRRGMVVALLGGTLFVPVFEASAGVPLLRTKAMFVAGVVLILSLVLDARRWIRFRPSLLDLPVLVLCAAPYLAATANDLGAYEAWSAVFAATLVFGGPYLLGRVYLGHRRGLAELAVALVGAGLVYVPLCLWEIRMSPQLHRLAYGYSPTAMFAQNMRFGGFRPVVFMNHGLMVALFMASATLVAYWLWRTAARRKVAGIPLGAAWAVLGVTTLLCKSTGAAALLLVGIAVLEGTRLLRLPVLVLLLAAVPPVYCAARLAGWAGDGLVAAAANSVAAERAQSVGYRFVHETALVEKAMERPWLGWGRWGRSRIHDPSGRDVSVTDSMWIIALGETGLVGLLSLGLVLGLPVLLLLRAAPARHWAEPRVASAAALAAVALIGMVDDLLNTMATPAVLVIAGALISLWVAARAARAVPARRARPGPAAPRLPLPAGVAAGPWRGDAP
ncbi:MAG: hypothetical protein HZB56_23115 [Deltaproteobacteria bacterium]|nr:hypothetical protein [Deltaproteobacteria bacterium]